MVKPQFEVGRDRVGSGGVVRDPEAREDAVRGVIEAIEAEGGRAAGTADSGLPGPEGQPRDFVLAVDAARRDERRAPPCGSAEPISIEQAGRGQAGAAADPPRARGHRLDPARRPLDPRRRPASRCWSRRARWSSTAALVAVLVERRHGPAPGRRGPHPGAGRRRQHPARAGAGGRLRRAGDRRQLRPRRLPGLDRARDARARPAPRPRRRVRHPRAAVAEGRVGRGRGAGGQRPRPLPRRRGAHRRPHLRGRRRAGGHRALRRRGPEHAGRLDRLQPRRRRADGLVAGALLRDLLHRPPPPRQPPAGDRRRGAADRHQQRPGGRLRHPGRRPADRARCARAAR